MRFDLANYNTFEISSSLIKPSAFAMLTQMLKANNSLKSIVIDKLRRDYSIDGVEWFSKEHIENLGALYSVLIRKNNIQHMGVGNLLAVLFQILYRC